MISEACVAKLALPTIRSSSHIAGFNSTGAAKFTRKVTAWMLSRFNDEPIMSVTFTVVPNILLHVGLAAPGHTPISPEIVEHLADPCYQRPDPVLMLLGAGVWARTVQSESILQPGGPLLQKMSFGWIVFGSMKVEPEIELFTGAATVTNNNTDLLETQLQRFWEMEDVFQEKLRTEEQVQCEVHFIPTHSRSKSGRYVIRIPTRPEISTLGASREIALRRFYQLERRLQANGDLREKYTDVIRDYQALGHLRQTDRQPSPVSYYVPHHCVTKKFRVVFDGSCRTTTGASFNDMQLVGERLQEDLLDLIIRFRWHAIAITADVKQMYRQVQVHPDDWDLQRIFWREGPNQQLRE